MLEQRISQGAQHRLGMPPADGLQRAPGVGDIDGLVADVTEIPGAVTPEELDDFAGAGVADERCHRDIGAFLIPVVHGFHEPLPGLRAGR